MATKKRKPRPEKRKPWPPQKHDRAYRRFFSLREMVIDLVRGFIPEDWVQYLDFAHMKQLPDVFIGEEYDRRDADTIWQIGWKARTKASRRSTWCSSSSFSPSPITGPRCG